MDLKTQASIKAPFTPAQVQTLNEVQTHTHELGIFHPFTCPRRTESAHGMEGGDLGVLIATHEGWVCPHCGYTQDWAWAAMTNPPQEEQGESSVDFFNRYPADTTIKRIKRVEQVIEEYLDLAQKLDEQAENAILIMVECLRKRVLSLHGIETRPGQTLALESTWIERTSRLPDENDEVEVILYNHAAKDSADHPGFGTGCWVAQSCMMDAQNMFLIEAVQSVYVTHWRPLPAPEFTDNVPESIKEIVREIGQLGVDGKLTTEKMDEFKTRINAATSPNGG